MAYENQTAGLLVGVDVDDIFRVDLKDDILDDLGLLDFFGLCNLLGVLGFGDFFYSLLGLLLACFLLLLVTIATVCLLSLFIII
jgi:hypothetical protein